MAVFIKSIALALSDNVTAGESPACIDTGAGLLEERTLWYFVVYGLTGDMPSLILIKNTSLAVLSKGGVVYKCRFPEINHHKRIYCYSFPITQNYD